VKSNTGTATTAIVEGVSRYRGRFAPSPTGLLHLGSLATALASYLDARLHAGRWLIRVEDLDAQRTIAGVETSILDTLSALTLVSDEPVVRQSARHARYEAALQQLLDKDAAYPCTCSRSEAPGVYSGHCRDQHGRKPGAAYRLRLDASRSVKVDDRVQGMMVFDNAALGDPVIFRRDGVAAYQLAVVVDDAAQGVTHVVRGEDLADNTPRQIHLQHLLGLPTPAYLHTPLVLGADGDKLSKHNGAQPLVLDDPLAALRSAGAVLGVQSDAKDIAPWLAEVTLRWRRLWSG
jgi:glutamyl-Q tRNA(Asp) synthetase